MSEQPPPPAPAGDEEGSGNPNAAFLPIGIVFLVLGLAGLANDSMRASAFAFLPVGIVFMVLSIRSAAPGAAASDGPAVSAGPEAHGPDGPDVTPR